MPSEPDRHLEQLLEQAGADARPRSHRWDEFPSRLAQTPQSGPQAVRWWTILSGAAAVIALGIGIALYVASGPVAMAQPQPIQVIPNTIEITVFNETEVPAPTLYMPAGQQGEQTTQRMRVAPQQRPQPAARDQGQLWNMQTVQGPDWVGGRSRGQPGIKAGMTLVKDRRIVMNLQKGDNLVRFTDVAATIDPTSVRFVSDSDPSGTTIVEQNFEYDLATAGALLKRFVDKKVTVLAKDGEQTEGYLCSHDDQAIVLADREPRAEGGGRKTQTIPRAALLAVRLPEVPPDLFVKPTLVWKVRTQREGRHDTTLTYLCGEAKWEATYVAVVTPGDLQTGDRLDLQGWVTIDNRSGATYRDAGIKLIAGDVNRVPDPWAPVVLEEDQDQKAFKEAEDRLGDLAFAWFGKGFVEKSFFEYHMYTLSAPSTVKDRQTKQLKLLKAAGVQATRRFVFDPRTDDRHPAVYLEFKNDEDHHLGMPLPKGSIRFMQRDADGDVIFIGQTEIDHTPKDEEMKLRIGSAFDVAAEVTQTDTRMPSSRREIQTFRLRMRNHKSQAINARFVEHMQPHKNWSITEATDPCTRKDVDTIHFDFVLDANQEKTITYVVDYQW